VDLKERCYSILIVSSSAKFDDSLLSILINEKYRPIDKVSDISSARRALLEKDYDIVIINAPLPDEFGTELALDVCEKTSSGVMMFVKSDVYSVVDDKVSGYGVLTISRPTTIQTITQSLALLCSTRERLRKMEQKTASIEDKMDEIRIVNHAKWLLIEQLRFSEKEAHKFIEKRAMDRCMSKRAVAEEIIATYNK
jgi:response regulator NasT